MAGESGAPNEPAGPAEGAEPVPERGRVVFKNSDLPVPPEPRGLGSTPLLLSLAPFAVFAVLYFVLPQYGARLFQARPNDLFVPLKLLGLFLALAWAGFGSFLVSESSSYGRAIFALMACTLPASVMVVVAPGW